MEEVIAIDRAGRLVIPARLRRKLHLVPGSRFRVSEDGARLILEPVEGGSPVEEKDGLIVLGARLLDADLDHRSDRDDRLEKLSRVP